MLSALADCLALTHALTHSLTHALRAPLLLLLSHTPFPRLGRRAWPCACVCCLRCVES